MISEINFLQSTHTSMVLQSSINSLGNCSSSSDLSTDLDFEENLEKNKHFKHPVLLLSTTPILRKFVAKHYGMVNDLVVLCSAKEELIGDKVQSIF